MVFADIPEHCQKGEIQIEMCSPYDNYATYITEISVGKRDVAILDFLKQKSFDLGCAMLILIVAIVLLMLAVVQVMTHKKTGGIEYLGVYLLLLSIYHLIETKVPGLFYGNQTLYSNLIFIILMTETLFIEVYFYEAIPKMRKNMGIFMIISTVNVVVQLGLQLTGLMDFMNMSFLSHGIIVLLIFYISLTLVKGVSKEKIQRISYSLSVFAA